MHTGLDLPCSYRLNIEIVAPVSGED